MAFSIASLDNEVLLAPANNRTLSSPSLDEATTAAIFARFSAMPETYAKYIFAKNAIQYSLAPLAVPVAQYQSIVSGYWDNGTWVSSGYWDNGAYILTAADPSLGSAEYQLSIIINSRYTTMRDFCNAIEWEVLRAYTLADNAGWNRAVNAYNNSGWSGNLVYQSIIVKMQGYFMQGQAARGNLSAAIAHPYYDQMVQDAKPSAGQAFVATVIFALITFGALSGMSMAAEAMTAAPAATTTTGAATLGETGAAVAAVADTGATLGEVTAPAMVTTTSLETGMTVGEIITTAGEVISAGTALNGMLNNPQVKPPVAAPTLTTAQLQAQALAQAQNSSKSAYVLGGAALLGLVFLKLAIL